MTNLTKWNALSLRKKVCLCILAVYILIAIFAPAIMHYEIDDFSHPSLEAPNSTYWLGTDEMGHDLFSLLIHGFRLTVALALIIATYTPVFDWISYPMGLYLNLLGVEEAFAVAPATLVGFTDMFIPALLIGGIQSVKTKFVIGALSLVQIIYLTEVGAIIIKSEIPLNLWKLFVLFLERTLIAIPLLVLCANIFL